jgi:peptidoglycan/LPS O-acetylase OafA/YrhL
VRPASRYLFIDALRGFAALSVVAFHVKEAHQVDRLCAALPAAFGVLLDHAYLGVEVFFVLSGLVIGHSMARDRVTLGYVARFMVRRSIRLDPPYWASIALSVAFAYLSTRIVPGKTYTPPSGPEVLAHVAYLPVLLRIPLINPIYWTLCLEIQFYLVYALLMMAATRSPWARSFYLVVLPCVAFADLWATGTAPFHVVGLFTEPWYYFLLGVLAGRAATRPDDTFARTSCVANLGVLAIAAIGRRDPDLAVAVVTATAILIAGVKRRLGVWLRAPALQELGAISYSLYLIHVPIAGAAFRLYSRAFARAAEPTVAYEAGWLALGPAVCVAAAWAFHRAIEKPTLTLSQRVRVRTASPALAAEPAVRVGHEPANRTIRPS